MKNELIYQDLLNARVCSEGTWDEALEWICTYFPSGTFKNWYKKEGKLDTGKNSSPVVCAKGQGTHYMFIC